MTVISFKDVGAKGIIRNADETLRLSNTPIGIKTPLELDENGDAIFVMHKTYSEQINDNLRNLILTNHGERLMLTDFGANLRPLLTEWSNKDNFDEEAMARITSAVGKYMPYVNLIGFESKPNYRDNIHTGIVDIYIQYSVPALGFQNGLLHTTLWLT